jgi:hypothetical protein
MRRRAVKSLLLVIAAGLVLALGTAAPAGAAVPCWKTLINDWYDGQIDRTYPPACYTAAVHHLPQDVSTYSSAKDDIERALLASVRQDRGGDPPTYDPRHPGGGDGSASSGGGENNGASEGSSKGIITKAIEWLGPSNAASVPLPLLILAGVAFLLLAAAGGSFVNRRIQERRSPPPPTA